MTGHSKIVNRDHIVPATQAVVPRSIRYIRRPRDEFHEGRVFYSANRFRIGRAQRLVVATPAVLSVCSGESNLHPHTQASNLSLEDLDAGIF